MDTDKQYKKLIQEISIKIKEIRLSRGYTQEDMMDLGFNYRFFQKLESGTYSPNLRTLHRLALALGVDLKDLLP